MPTKSKYVIALDRIQAKVHGFLKRQGFRKKGRTHNREAEEKGIFQVIHFQSGPFPIGENYVLPGFRDNLYGKFAINMGVLIKELYDLDDWHKPTDFYQEMYCQARTRLEQLVGRKDFSWDLEGDVEKIGDEIVLGLNSIGFEYFELYDTREKFIQNYGKYKDCPPRAQLDVALVVLHQDREAGENLFCEYYRNIIQKGHRAYVGELAEKLGIKLDRHD